MYMYLLLLVGIISNLSNDVSVLRQLLRIRSALESRHIAVLQVQKKFPRGPLSCRSEQ